MYENEITARSSEKALENEQYDFEAEQREIWKSLDPNYLKTVSMPELYETVYASRPPVIDGLRYAIKINTTFNGLVLYQRKNGIRLKKQNQL